MTNKERKKKVIKWLLRGLGFLVIFAGEVMLANEVNFDLYAVVMLYGIVWLVSIFGFIISVIMFVFNLISCWVNNTPEIVQQQVVRNDSDALVQLSRMYHDGLLTKQEFEKQKKQLLGDK